MEMILVSGDQIEGLPVRRLLEESVSSKWQVGWNESEKVQVKVALTSFSSSRTLSPVKVVFCVG